MQSKVAMLRDRMVLAARDELKWFEDAIKMVVHNNVELKEQYRRIPELPQQQGPNELFADMAVCHAQYIIDAFAPRIWDRATFKAYVQQFWPDVWPAERKQTLITKWFK